MCGWGCRLGGCRRRWRRAAPEHPMRVRGRTVFQAVRGVRRHRAEPDRGPPLPPLEPSQPRRRERRVRRAYLRERGSGPGRPMASRAPGPPKSRGGGRAPAPGAFSPARRLLARGSLERGSGRKPGLGKWPAPHHFRRQRLTVAGGCAPGPPPGKICCCRRRRHHGPRQSGRAAGRRRWPEPMPPRAVM